MNSFDLWWHDEANKLALQRKSLSWEASRAGYLAALRASADLALKRGFRTLADELKYEASLIEGSTGERKLED
jgi:hypothetical protein